MTKRILVVVFIITFLVALAVILFPDLTRPVKHNATNSETILGTESDEPNYYDFDYSGKKARIVWMTVSDTQKISLLANFAEKLPATKLAEENSCTLAINGGFYTKEGSPTGLFITDGRAVENFAANSLTNGIFSINYALTPRITRAVPQDSLKIAVQSGPIVFENGSPAKLSMIRDEEARRVLIGVTGENKAMFMAIYFPDSTFNGPRLSDVPEILNTFNIKSNLFLADAVNLDGGSASTFLYKGLHLTEASPVGSMFCVK